LFDVAEMKELVEKLNKYRDAYYNQNTSLITDREYDSLYDKLCQMERESGLILSNSPTQSVGYEIRSKLPKVKHNHPLLSLDKTTDTQEFLDFFGGKEFILMAKLDGLTVSIKYDKGKFVSAETRGDGEIGEDISHNAPMFKNLPLTIPYDGELIVDGECIIYEDELQKINKRENTDYKNVRNLVSGTVRQLDSKICANRNVYFIAWKLQTIPKSEYYHYLFTQPNPKNPPRPVVDLNLHNDRLQFLSDLGFDTVKRLFITQNKNLPTIEAYIHWLKSSCELLHMPIDGIVGMFNDIKYGESLGMTGHHPKHSLAFKFYQEENETTLKDIEWATSRTGQVNPVAVFEPVEIDGTTVSRATLNNVSCIKEFELGIGDTITVIKSNQIIPMVAQNLTRSNTYKIPEVCPSCGHPTVIKNDNGREMLYCTNRQCKAVLHDSIANFASRNAMNIVGISDERLRVLIDEGFIEDYTDLYDLKYRKDELVKLSGFGGDSVNNMLQAIEDSRDCEMANVIVAIGIPNIGKSTAKIIAEECARNFNPIVDRNVLDTLLWLATGEYDWSELPSIGELTSNVINDYVFANASLIMRLKNNLNIKMPALSNINQDDWQAGKTFCITGKLEHFDNRAALVYDIEIHGGKVVSSVTKKTDYLITNDKTSGSSKNKAAAKHGTKIITEAEYCLGDKNS
jgi:DNA ligase (NAD+)